MPNREIVNYCSSRQWGYTALYVRGSTDDPREGGRGGEGRVRGGGWKRATGILRKGWMLVRDWGRERRNANSRRVGGGGECYVSGRDPHPCGYCICHRLWKSFLFYAILAFIKVCSQMKPSPYNLPNLASSIFEWGAAAAAGAVCHSTAAAGRKRLVGVLYYAGLPAAAHSSLLRERLLPNSLSLVPHLSGIYILLTLLITPPLPLSRLFALLSTRARAILSPLTSYFFLTCYFFFFSLSSYTSHTVRKKP